MSIHEDFLERLEAKINDWVHKVSFTGVDMADYPKTLERLKAYRECQGMMREVIESTLSTTKKGEESDDRRWIE